MYLTSTGDEIFIIDTHVHWWDGSAANQRNAHGEEFISCFYGYHTFLSPPQYKVSRDQFDKYSPETMHKALFEDGYDDMAIFQPTYLKEFFTNGFNTTEQNAVLKEQHPERYILNGSFDPREGEAGLEYLHELVEKYHIKGVKLYTAEWNGNSRGYKLTDPWALRYLEACRKLGVVNIHVHKGPTIRPLDKDAFDVHDIDGVAGEFRDLRFIVEHVGLPRLDDFCWIATQEYNVYGGLAVAMAFIHNRPEYFAHIISELLYWLGPEKLMFASDYGIWHPRWIVEEFMNFELPESIAKEKNVILDMATKKKIMGENAAALYGIDIAAQKELIRTASAVASPSAA